MKSFKTNVTAIAGLNAVLAFAAVASATPALAHHAMGGAMPGSFMEGFLSGIAHPVIGFDHLAFLISVGVASAFLTARYLMPALFVGATIVGCLLYSVGGVALPMTEFAIAGSVLLLGVLVMSGRELSPTICAVLFALAGLFHGSAYAASILGAETTPLAAYLIGFSLVQYAVAALAIVVVRETWKASSAISTQPRLVGALVAGIGATFFIENIEALVFPGL